MGFVIFCWSLSCDFWLLGLCSNYFTNISCIYISDLHTSCVFLSYIGPLPCRTWVWDCFFANSLQIILSIIQEWLDLTLLVKADEFLPSLSRELTWDDRDFLHYLWSVLLSDSTFIRIVKKEQLEGYPM